MIPLTLASSRHRPLALGEEISPEYLPTAVGTTANPTAAAEQVIYAVPIAPNLFRIGRKISVAAHVRCAVASTFRYRVRFGTTGTTADTLLFDSATTAAQAVNSYMSAMLDVMPIAVGASGQLVVSGCVTATNAIVGRRTGAFAIPTVSTNTASFLTITVQPNVAGAHTTLAASISL